VSEQPKQTCANCGAYTGRCAEDQISDRDGNPICEECCDRMGVDSTPTSEGA